MKEIKIYKGLFKIKELDSNLRFFLSVLISLAELNNGKYRYIIQEDNFNQLFIYFNAEQINFYLNELNERDLIRFPNLDLELKELTFVRYKEIGNHYYKIPNNILNYYNSVLSIEAIILAIYIYNMNKINVYAFKYKYLSNNLAIPEDDVKNLMIDLRNENIVEWRKDTGFIYLLDESKERKNNCKDVFILHAQFLNSSSLFYDSPKTELETNFTNDFILKNIDITDKCILSFLYYLTCKNYRILEYKGRVERNEFIKKCGNTLGLFEDDIIARLRKLSHLYLINNDKYIQFRTDSFFEQLKAEYVNIDKDLLSKVKRMSLQKKVVLSYIKNYSKGMRADNKHLCELFGLSYRVITKMLKEFDRHNLITITYKDGRDYERRKSKNRIIKVTEENEKVYEELIESGTYLSKMNLDDEDLDDNDEIDNDFHDEDLANELNMNINLDDLDDEDLDDIDDMNDLIDDIDEIDNDFQDEDNLNDLIDKLDNKTIKALLLKLQSRLNE